MTTNLFINKRIKKARIEAGFRYVTDLHKRLNEIHMPTSYKRLTQLEL